MRLEDGQSKSASQRGVAAVAVLCLHSSPEGLSPRAPRQESACVGNCVWNFVASCCYEKGENFAVSLSYIATSVAANTKWVYLHRF